MYRLPKHSGLLAALIILTAIYATTIQTIPNGSSHYYMIDVGETQIVLNNWGTLHMTGYPHYTILGNILTDIMTGGGVDVLLAPAFTSLLWGLISLVLVYVLVYHITGREILAASLVLLYGLTRTVWIHQVIAEIYTFGLLILLGLLLLALWQPDLRHRIYWLALLGGVGVAHHRAIAMTIPALLYAVSPHFIQMYKQNRKQLIKLVAYSVLLGFIGFIPYIYLYLRAKSGAAWIYGQPDTWDGLWFQFMGKEASRFIGAPDTWDGLWQNIDIVNQVLIRDLTVPGIVAGLSGLTISLWTHRRAGITLMLSGLVAYVFHLTFYTDVLSALILPITLSLAFGWLFLLDWLMTLLENRWPMVEHIGRQPLSLAMMPPAILTGVGLFCAVLYTTNHPFIKAQVTDQTGLHIIEQLRAVPDGATVMIGWGPRFFAASIAHELQDDLQHLTFVDHNADFAKIVQAGGTLVTPEYTFYSQPVAWWQERLDMSLYIRAVAPYMVEIATQPLIADDSVTEITPIDERLICDDEQVILTVTWQAGSVQPDADYSIYVHVLDENGAIIAQGDQQHPVYGWRPVTTWLANERVQDVYPIDMIEGVGVAVRYGLYQMLPEGGFENVSEYILACDDA